MGRTGRWPTHRFVARFSRRTVGAFGGDAFDVVGEVLIVGRVVVARLNASAASAGSTNPSSAEQHHVFAAWGSAR